jgi:hypothetical protein
VNGDVLKWKYESGKQKILRGDSVNIWNWKECDVTSEEFVEMDQ